MKNSYQTAIDELNILWQAGLQTAGRDPERVCGDLRTLLVLAYREGVQSAGEMLDANLDADLDGLEAALFLRIDGKTFEDRAREHLAAGDAGRLRALGESECHRVYHAGLLDGAEAFRERTGRAVRKTWRTLLDDRVRDTHDYLEGVSVPLEAEFYTFDGDHAPGPGGFGRAENNANCRCFLQLHGEGTP